MAEGKKSFLAYCDWKEMFDSLPDDKAGQLIKHIFAYVNDEDPQSEDFIINALFANIKNTLKRDLVKYENFIEKQRLNGGKGGRPPKPKTTQNNPTVNLANPEKPNTNPLEAKEPDRDRDRDRDRVIEEKKNIEYVYSLYPAKCPIKNTSTGKGSKDKEKIKQLLKTHSVEDLSKIIKFYLEDNRKGERFIMNFKTLLGNLPDIEDKSTGEDKDIVFYRFTHDQTKRSAPKDKADAIIKGWEEGGYEVIILN